MTDNPTSEGVREEICFCCLTNRVPANGSYAVPDGGLRIVGPDEPCADPQHPKIDFKKVAGDFSGALYREAIKEARLDGWRKGREAAIACIPDGVLVTHQGEGCDLPAQIASWVSKMRALPEPKE